MFGSMSINYYYDRGFVCLCGEVCVRVVYVCECRVRGCMCVRAYVCVCGGAGYVCVEGVHVCDYPG